MSGRAARAVPHGSQMPTDGGPTADEQLAAGGIRRYRPRLVIAVAGAAIVLITVIRWRAGDPADATNLLFTLPIALLAATLGARAGALRQADAERARLAARARRHREAIEINDSLMQGLSAIKWSLEAGNTHQALAMTTENLERGHRLVSDLIRDAGLAGEWTGTSTPNATP